MSSSSANAGRSNVGKSDDPAAVLRELETTLHHLHAAVVARDLAAIQRHTVVANALVPQAKRFLEGPFAAPLREPARAVHAASYNAGVMVRKAKTTVQALMAVYRSIPGPIPEAFQQEQP